MLQIKQWGKVWGVNYTVSLFKKKKSKLTPFQQRKLFLIMIPIYEKKSLSPERLMRDVAKGKLDETYEAWMDNEEQFLEKYDHLLMKYYYRSGSDAWQYLLANRMFEDNVPIISIIREE